MLAMRPQTKSLFSVKRSGPGVSPHTNRPAMITAAVGDPGTPRVIIGRRDPTLAALAQACGAGVPAGSPLPKFARSFSGAYWRAPPYERNDAGGAPGPGRAPIHDPR